MKHLIVIGLLVFVAAKHVTAQARGPVTIDRMTCKEAYAYATKYGRYWKNMGPDGAIPIYPVHSLEKVNCGGRTGTSPIIERTRDRRDCIVGWYCRSQ